MNDLISKKWLIECVNEGWIKFDTERDKNIFIHLIRDIAPPAQPVYFANAMEFLKSLAIKMQRNNITIQEACYVVNDMQCVTDLLTKEYANMVKRNISFTFGKSGKPENGEESNK